MKRKLLLLAEVLGAVALALAGILGNPSVARAAMPLPVQPWDVDTDIRTSTTALDATYINQSLIFGPYGARIAASYWYSEGLQTPPDKDTLDGTQTGGLLAYYDIFCNATGPTDIDTLADASSVHPNYVREPWVEATTEVMGTGEEWLLAAGPPFAVSWRLFGTFDTVFSSTGVAAVIAGGIDVNLLAYTLTWSPKMALTYSIVGSGSAAPSTTCSDSSSGTDSHITGIFSNPPPEGDSGAPCDVATKDCADKQIHGFWTQGRVELAAAGNILLPVTKRVLNSGPEEGDFVDIWDVEAPTGVTATFAGAVDQSHWDGSAWVDDSDPTVSGGDSALISFPETDLEVSVPVQYVGTLSLTCTAPGDYLVTLKDFTYPTDDTEDPDLASNMQLYVVRLICGSPAATETDKKIITLRKTLTAVSSGSESLNLPLVDEPTGEHVQLLVGDTATVSVDATIINLSTVAVTGEMTFSAEVPAGGGVEAIWPDSGTPTLQYTTSEQPGTPAAGQIDEIADLNITCNAPGIYPVAVKVIDMPVGVGDKKPADNARYNVIKVWCWASEGDKLAADDGVDDAAGFTVRWTLLPGRPDIPEMRKPFDKNNPLALRSDDRYVERTVDGQCFWVDTDGALNQNGDVFTGYAGPPPVIEAWESQLDPNRPYGLDDDQDCLADPLLSQPSHPVDEVDGVDADGDGVSDAVETAMASNPASAASKPEANLGANATKHATCTDGVDNDADTLTDTDPQCANTDADGDGWADWFEAAMGTDGDATETPEGIAAPMSCADGQDNDGDGDIDGADSGCAAAVQCATAAVGSIGALLNNNTSNDEDCDGLKDGIEKAWGSNPMLIDSDSDGATDWQEMMAFTNPVNPDTDADGLLDKPDDDYWATPYGGAVNSVPETALLANCGDGVDNDADGRADSADPGCDATDTDADTIADVDENALDSDPGNALKKPEAWIAGTCADGIDNDGDGKTDTGPPPNPRCPTGGDTDLDTYKDVDEAGLGSAYLNEAGGEAANSDDNCPYIYNPDQANNDGRPVPNGAGISGAFRSNPTSDTLGDACDPDDDNDRAYDASETQTLLTDPYKQDTDGDRVVDGVESMTGYSPTNPASKPSLLNDTQQTLFRTCHMNLPDATKWPAYVPGYSGSYQNEMDPDADGINCPRYNTPPPGSGDKDADNGSSSYCPTPGCALVEIEDLTEIKGYNTAAAVPDTDGDGCEDWIEIADINGDRVANALDRSSVNSRLAGLIPVNAFSDVVFDVNKDNILNALDASVVAANSSLVKSPGSCIAAGAPSTDQQRALP